MRHLRGIEWWSYALLALGAVAGALATPGHIIGDGVDMYGTFWFYWWIQDCLLHLRDPSFTDLMFYPLGKDIFSHTGNNFLDALVSVPFQALGFPRYQPWFVAALLFGNAVTFRPLAKRVLERPWAVWGATALWLLNPYVLFECMCGRFTQAMLWFLPLAVLQFLEIGAATDPRARRRAAALAGLYTALQAYTYWFMGYFMALIFLWLALVDLWRSSSRGALLRGYALAGAVCAALVGPAGVAMARRAGQGTVPGLSKGGLMDLPAELANNVSADLHGYTLMERWGQPMFLTLAWGGGALLFLIYGRDRLRWAGAAALGLLFAVGPVFPDLFGHRVPMPHYLLAYHLLPFLDRLWFPYRMLSVVFLVVVLGIGTFFARATDRLRLPGWVLPGLLVLTGLVEQHRLLAWPLLHRDLTPPAVYTFLHDQGGALIELPIGMSRISIAWQPVHQQPVWGGMGENAKLLWPKGFEKRTKNSFIRMLVAATRSPDVALTLSLRPGERESLEQEGFRWVVLDRMLVESMARHDRDIPDINAFLTKVVHTLSARLGGPTAVEGALVVWDLRRQSEAPAALQPDEATLYDHTWTPERPPAYEENLQSMGRFEGRPVDGPPPAEAP